jgi:hypothetical protein
MLKQYYEKNINNTGNHNPYVLYLELSPKCCC